MLENGSIEHGPSLDDRAVAVSVVVVDGLAGMSPLQKRGYPGTRRTRLRANPIWVRVKVSVRVNHKLEAGMTACEKQQSVFALEKGVFT